MVIHPLNQIDRQTDPNICCNGNCGQGKFCPLYDQPKPQPIHAPLAAALLLAVVFVLAVL